MICSCCDLCELFFKGRYYEWFLHRKCTIPSILSKVIRPYSWLDKNLLPSLATLCQRSQAQSSTLSIWSTDSSFWVKSLYHCTKQSSSTRESWNFFEFLSFPSTSPAVFVPWHGRINTSSFGNHTFSLQLWQIVLEWGLVEAAIRLSNRDLLLAYKQKEETTLFPDFETWSETLIESPTTGEQSVCGRQKRTQQKYGFNVWRSWWLEDRARNYWNTLSEVCNAHVNRRHQECLKDLHKRQFLSRIYRGERNYSS